MTVKFVSDHTGDNPHSYSHWVEIYWEDETMENLEAIIADRKAFLASQ